jgi:orotidine-5'-phosphate decarboxylase
MRLTHFGDRFYEITKARGPICAGIDPRLDSLPGAFGSTHASMVSWCGTVARIAAKSGKVAAIKPQIAFFGDRWPSINTVAHEAKAEDQNMLTIADCKRGDIDSTAEAYAEEIFCFQDNWFDAITVNPYLGTDSIIPFAQHASRQSKGLFVLVRTSNPGANDIQSLKVADSNETVAERVARMVSAIGSGYIGKNGLSLVGAVVGLTAPVDVVRRMRELMPNTPFLMPGWGAQGGNIESYRAAIDARGGGVIVNASRSLTLPWKGMAPDDWDVKIMQAIEKMHSEIVG